MTESQQNTTQSSPVALRNSIIITSVFVALLWVIKTAEGIAGFRLTEWGVFPLVFEHLWGILTAPMIHGSVEHLLGNSIALMLLGTTLLYGYPKSRWWVVAIVWFGSGLGVWLFARESFHIGASGLTHGIFFFLLIGGILRRDKRSIALLMIAFFMYGSMILTIFPREPQVSFESHFFGAIAGTFCAILFRRWDPKPERKTYSWERVNSEGEVFEEDEDPLIGDLWKPEHLREHNQPESETQDENYLNKS